MPITVSFDLENYAANHHSRLLSMFERFGWQSIGGTSFRYPRLGTEQPVEDWFNHVVPALMLLRAYAVRYPGRISRFSIDAQSMSGCEPNSGYGNFGRFMV
jgi:hypothetical protein